jgi:cytochrome b subunit of formate dehydrogenase
MTKCEFSGIQRSRSVKTGVLALLLFLVAGRAEAQSNEDCLACHSDESLTMEKNGKTVPLFVKESILAKSPHQRLSCIACHTGFDKDNIPHKEPITPINCMTCHRDAPPKHAFHPQMMRATGRNGTPDISCKSCHGTHDVVSPNDPASRTSPAKQPEFCGKCHATERKAFSESAHGHALGAGTKGAPNCVACHRNDLTKIRPGRDSVQVKIAQEKFCLSCHLDDESVRGRVAPSARFIAAYEHSVHGSALQAGNAKAANCVDCHGSHQMLKGNDPASKVYRFNIPQTCAKCHAEVSKEFAESIHGKALSQGNTESPTCTNCHGEHNILARTDPSSPTSAKNISSQVCSPCHSSVKLTQKYGIASDRFTTFDDSYHGLAIRGGSIEVANCTSCHGVHNIMPSADPASTTNKGNLAVTCGKCHRGANERFAIGSVHVDISNREDDPVLYWVATLYLVLIVSTIGGMLFHNTIDFIKKARRRLLVRRGVIHEEHMGHHLYLRMSLGERLQHGSLLVSFITLVITGFMLRYPNAWWVASIGDFSDEAFDLRGLIHRIAAVVMILAAIYHIYYVLFIPRGKELIRDLMPKFQDLLDARDVLKYNLGLSAHKPKFGRFSYIEKSEYWALVWGTIVMGLTGFIMWFDNTFIGLLTKLGYDVARLIHFYEAWLATLAIVVWHFYYVMFNPDTYPINLAFWTGTITEHEMHEEHPLELEAIRREETEEGMMTISGGESDDKDRT